MIDIFVSHRVLKCTARLASGERAEVRITGAGAESAAGLALWLCDDGRRPVAAAPSLAPGQDGTLTCLLNLATTEMDALVAGVPAGRALTLWTVLGDMATGEVLAAGRVSVCASWMPDDLEDLGGLADPVARMGDLAPAFDATASYEAGDVVCEGGALWVFTASHSGPWDAADAERTTLAEQLGQGGGEYLPLAGGTVTGDVLRDGASRRWRLDCGTPGGEADFGGGVEAAVEALEVVADALPGDAPGGIRCTWSFDYRETAGGAAAGSVSAECVLHAADSTGRYAGVIEFETDDASATCEVWLDQSAPDAALYYGVGGIGGEAGGVEETGAAPAPYLHAGDLGGAASALARAAAELGEAPAATVAQFRVAIRSFAEALARAASLLPALAALLLAGGAAAVPLEDVDLSLDVDTNSMAETSAYATRPWWPAVAEYVPVRPAAAVTNGDTWAWTAGTDGVGARLEVATDSASRPVADAYDAPAGSWSVAGGVMGPDGVVAATADVVRAVYAPSRGGGDPKGITLNLRSASPGEASGNIDGTVQGTWRWRSSQALLGAFAAASTNAVSTYPYCRPWSHAPGYTNWVCPDAFQRFGAHGSGGWYGVPAVANDAFFWPQLAAALQCSTIHKRDNGASWGSQLLIVSPHYAVGAAHAGYFRGCVATSLDPLRILDGGGVHGAVGGRTYSWGIPTSTRPSSVGDAQVVRLSQEYPSNCIARLADAACLAALSPSFPRRWPGFALSCHQTCTPVAVSGTTTNQAGVAMCAIGGTWAMDGYDAPLQWRHLVHVGDSSSLVAATGPSGQLIPLFLFYSASAGPALYGDNVDAIDAIIRADSDGAEGVWRWTPEELQ